MDTTPPPCSSAPPRRAWIPPPPSLPPPARDLVSGGPAPREQPASSFPAALRLRHALRAHYGLLEGPARASIPWRVLEALRALLVPAPQRRAELLIEAVRWEALDIDQIARLDQQVREQARRVHAEVLGLGVVALLLAGWILL